MKRSGYWRYRILRGLGRLVTRAAALLTLGHMPPFVSIAAIVEDQGRILVVLDPILGEPTLPGGHLKWAERPLEALVREVREETGYVIDPRELIGVYAGEEWCREPGVVRLVYKATISDGSLRSSNEGEAVWTDLADVAASQSKDAAIVREWLAHTTH